MFEVWKELPTDAINTLVTIAIGLTICLGIPIALTALLIVILRRLDERWQAQAKEKLLARLIYGMVFAILLMI